MSQIQIISGEANCTWKPIEDHARWENQLLIKSYESPFFVPAFKLNFVIDLPRSEEKITKQTDVKSLEPPSEEKINKQTDGKSLEKPVPTSTAIDWSSMT